MTDEEIRELFEVNCHNLEVSEHAEWHEYKQRYTAMTSKQHDWVIFKEAFKLGLLYGRN